MRVSSVRIVNYRSIADSGVVRLGPITLLVGRNNTGKSAFLASIFEMQAQPNLPGRRIRFGEERATVEIDLEQVDGARHWQSREMPDVGRLTIPVYLDGERAYEFRSIGGASFSAGRIANNREAAFVIPYLAGRKVVNYDEAVSLGAANEIRPDLSNLAARTDQLMDRHHPGHNTFMELLDKVIGIPLSAISSVNGKKVGIWMNGDSAIYIDEMGSGVAQLLGLISHLCLSRGRLFMIEELENDLHPEALKALLGAIGERRQENQFLISTHSNIVVRELGAFPDTLIYELSIDAQVQPPRTVLQPIPADAGERTALLSRLGYELSDFGLWDGWLILEESSAEVLIRTYFIAWYTPNLRGIRTVASQGIADVERSFEALAKLVLYTHLEPAYKGRVAVLVDGDGPGASAVSKLRGRFHDWVPESFDTFEEEDFELYYPPRFARMVEHTLGQNLKHEKRAAKKELLDQVLAWIAEDEETARIEFSDSAKDVIEKLRVFERRLALTGPPRRDAS